MPNAQPLDADVVIPPLSTLPRTPRRRSSSTCSPRLLAQDSPSLMPRKLTHSSSAGLDEHALNEMEWEEERLINALTQKLEKLRADKAKLENDLEAESELMVLKLQRQLQQLQAQQQDSPAASPVPPDIHLSHLVRPATELDPQVLLQENTSLRQRLTQAEAGYVKLSRLVDAYRAELIDLRTRLGIDVSDLVGVSRPVRRGSSSSKSRTVSFSSSLLSSRSSQLTEDELVQSPDTTPSTSYRSPPAPNTTPATSYKDLPPSRAPPNSLASTASSLITGSPTQAKPGKVHPCDVPSTASNYRVAETGRLMARGRSMGRSLEDEPEEPFMEMSPVPEHSN